MADAPRSDPLFASGSNPKSAVSQVLAGTISAGAVAICLPVMMVLEALFDARRYASWIGVEALAALVAVVVAVGVFKHYRAAALIGLFASLALAWYALQIRHVSGVSIWVALVLVTGQFSGVNGVFKMHRMRRERQRVADGA